MKKLLFLIPALLLLGCGNDPEVEPDEVGPLKIEIEGKAYHFFPEAVEAGVDENNISVFVHYATKKTDPAFPVGYGVGWSFSNGHFTEAVMSYIEDGENYGTYDFNPAETFSIKNYRFDPDTRKLSFDYEGKLHGKSHELKTNLGSITIKGSIDLDNIPQKSLQSDKSYATFHAGNFSFYGCKRIMGSTSEATSHHLFSNDGYRLMFIFDRPFPQYGATLPLTYEFDAQSTGNRISFFQFTGTPYSSDVKIVIKPEDWKEYPCSGSFTIEEITEDRIKGTFSMDIQDGDKVIHKTEDGEFLFRSKSTSM